MTLKLQLVNTGPLDNNMILLFDEESKQGVIFDPSFDPDQMLQVVTDQKIAVDSILFTHGHFDHFAGLAYLLAKLTPTPKVGLHKSDLKIWQEGGGSVHFRIPIDLPPDPDLMLEHGQKIPIGKFEIQVRHTPGHSPGSVIFYIPSLSTAVVGDLIFKQGIGRTDLDGGSFPELVNSISTQVFSLPAQTVLIPGHGPNTTVADEQKYNPYVGSDVKFL